jgi:ribonuclease HI
MQNVIEIYTDGACCGNPGKGGWGVLIKKDERYFEYGGFEEDTTNNRMEMTAAIEAMVEVADEEGPVVLYTDSQYLKKGITQWIHTWKVNNWKTSGKDPVKNLDLWQELDELNKPNIRWEWVRGHASDPYNCRVDKIATSYAKEEPVELFKGEKVDRSFFEEDCKTGSDSKKANKKEPSVKEAPDAVTEEKSKKDVSNQKIKVVNTEKTRSVNICLPFIETFAKTLAEKGFNRSTPGEGEVKYVFSGEDMKIDVYQSGTFIIIGDPAKVDDLASGIADADDRYLEKFMQKSPLDFPNNPEKWKQKHFDAFTRLFYKKMPSEWKYSFENNTLRIRDLKDERINLEIETDDEFSWKTPPSEDVYEKVKLFGELSVVYPDRFAVGLKEEQGNRLGFVILPLVRHSLNLGQSRLWRDIDLNFEKLDNQEKIRIKKQVTDHLTTYTRQSLDISLKNNPGEGENYKKVSQWFLDVLNLYFMYYFKPQSKIRIDLIADPTIKDFINEKMPALKFSEKTGIRKPADMHESLTLPLTDFIIKRM